MKTLLIIGLFALTGCASSGLNIACGNITGSDISYPGIVNKASANLYVCHVGCVGMNCKVIDPTVLQTVANTYFSKINTANSMEVTGPGKITFTPVGK